MKGTPVFGAAHVLGAYAVIPEIQTFTTIIIVRNAFDKTGLVANCP